MEGGGMEEAKVPRSREKLLSPDFFRSILAALNTVEHYVLPSSTYGGRCREQNYSKCS